MHSARSTLRLDLLVVVKASVDAEVDAGVGAEVDAGAGGTEAVAGAEVVALVSATGTTDDLGPLGTLAKA